MLQNVGVINLFVDDLEASRVFYRDVIGMKLLGGDEESAFFDFGNLYINLLTRSAAEALIAPAPVGPAAAAARVEFAILVDDVDVICDGLKTHGVTLINGPINRPWGKRTACFADPSGHLWELAADVPEGAE